MAERQALTATADTTFVARGKGRWVTDCLYRCALNEIELHSRLSNCTFDNIRSDVH